VELKPPQKQFNNQTQKTLEKFPQTTAESTWGSKQGRKRRKKIPIKWKQNRDQQRKTKKDSEANVVTQLDT
jgi:hypothetical protein